MTHNDALEALGLPDGATAAEIKAAVTEKNFDLEDKMAAAPTEALKAKFQIMLDKVTEAEKVLSQSSVKKASPLSQTKMADLPGTAPASISAAEKLQPGETLSNGRYEIKEQIGEGGMGAVYHAFDTTRQEDMAIKVLLPSMISSARAKERFMNEAKISSQLSHPNIVNVLDVQEDGDLTFLVMELLEGQDLRTLMDNRKLVRQEFDEKEAKELAIKLCDALQYAHKHTIHRDIKPENIWVTEEGEYKLMDFGIARVQSASQRTQTGAAMGTAYYMAPEQLKGTSNIDGRADQYALGILLYELLANEVPTGRFKSLNEVRTDINKGFSNAVDKALEPYPEERFDDMVGFSEALSSGKTTAKRKTNSPSTPMDTGKIRNIAIALVVVLGLGFGVNAFLGSQEEARIESLRLAKVEAARKYQEEEARLEQERRAKVARAEKAERAAERRRAKARAKDFKNRLKKYYSNVSIRAPKIAENGAVVPARFINLNLQPGDTASLSIEGTCRMFAAKNTGSKVVKSISMRIRLAKSSKIILSVNGHEVARKRVLVTIGGMGAENKHGLVREVLASALDFVLKPVSARSFRYGPTICMSSLSNNGNSYNALRHRSGAFKMRIKASSRKGLSIKALLNHPMDTGLRKNRQTGRRVPAHYIENAYVGINGREALRLYFRAGISKNPFLGVIFAGGRAGDKVDIVVADNKGKVGIGATKAR